MHDWPFFHRAPMHDIYYIIFHQIKNIGKYFKLCCSKKSGKTSIMDPIQKKICFQLAHRHIRQIYKNNSKINNLKNMV